MFTGSKALSSQVTSSVSTTSTEDDDVSTLELGSPELSSRDPIHSVPIFKSPISHDRTPAIPGELKLEQSTPTQSSTTWIHPNLLSPLPHCPPQPLFTLEQLGVDRRLLVNRKRQLKMYRVWMQGKFRKICS
jgi:tRNAThr (cytosine32-N3)-methyltransferase